ncbi:MAG: 5-(carboxyamino)imidazole ribonucleotide synthase [Gammaproteobacteria bacterium]|nr:5-(carboxyamino)imidazole ribonucleotide synthase [Gammaproteobacteria bacterium]MDH5239868.1 5-(carboxyamino)imidazole ribonucleotide synthase [Gammaproteobacteria bacterium]MDH5260372.1 5-(carboxyamino)imidazole ribonucleotide synthase [Gammaproteobacteria bacterium]MDH5582948.1 5-(carboxyamino)imidazole ribonucleotide synthase [Gammaproteobacteria bacterium]
MRIGIIGAGQLGQMLGFAAHDLNASCRYIDPSDDPPAAVCGKVIQASYDDPVALVALAETCDVITYEFENVPVTALQHIEGITPIYPPARALQHAQDRLAEKLLFDELEIPLPGYHAVDSREDLDAAAEKLGLPMVVKTRRMGYDGKGQFVVKDIGQLDAAWAALGTQSLVAEQFVPFDYEVSCIGVRRVSGDTAIYPLSRNVHVEGILHSARSPVDAPELTAKASDYMHRLLDHLDYVGVLALELFVVGKDLRANEFAPRVHNSGHWSIEGSETSQFENHLRAILDLPLGSTASKGYAGMVNLIGHISPATRALGVGVLHDYGKTSRPGRKLGHVTVVADSEEQCDALVEIIDKTVTQSRKPGETTT